MIINTEYRNGMYMFDSTGCLYRYRQSFSAKWFMDYYRNSKTIIDERLLVTDTKLYPSEQEYFWENQWKIFPLQVGDILENSKGIRVMVIKINQFERDRVIRVTYKKLNSITKISDGYVSFIEDYKTFVV